MILRTILHNAWIEWREQRSNLLGLWAGMLLLILAMIMFGGFDVVTDAVAPVAFAGLGYLGFVLTIMPRIFSGSAQRSTEALQRRCPAGIGMNFFGKALFLNLAMALSALLPALTVLALIYFSTPRTYEVVMSGRFDKDLLGPGFALHAAPLILMTWRLPARWVLVVLPLTIGMVLGALSLGTLGAFARQGVQPIMGAMVFVGLLLVPWLTTWSSFTISSGATKLRRSAMGLGLTCLAMSPALGIGLHGYVRNGFDFARFDPNSPEFLIQHAYLSPDGTQAYLTSYDYNNPDNLLALFGRGQYFRRHALRVTLATGEFERWQDQLFSVPTKGGLREGGRASYPHTTGLLLHEQMEGRNDAFQAVDLKTGKLTPLDSERVLVDYQENAEAMGLSHPWRARSIEVGLGVYLHARLKRHGYKEALYDPSRSKVFYDHELPFTFGISDQKVLVLPGKWLVGPEKNARAWHRFDPDSVTWTPVHGFEDGTSVGRALPDGKVLISNEGRFFLYDVDNDTTEPLSSQGGPETVSGWTFFNPLYSYQDCAPASLVQVTRFGHGPPPPGGKAVTFLGNLDRETNSIYWLPWDRNRRIVGAFDPDTLLFVQDGQRLARIDLNTGKEEILFPRPSNID